MQSNQEIILKDVVVVKQLPEFLKMVKKIILTNIEYSILLLLLEHPNKIFSIQNIYEKCLELRIRLSDEQHGNGTYKKIFVKN